MGSACTTERCQEIEKTPCGGFAVSAAALQIIHLAQSVKGFNPVVINVADR
jgi:hypothetical protein